MNDMTKNVVTGVAVSIAVSSFAITMSFGTLTADVASNSADVEMLKSVRTQHISELNELRLADSRLQAQVDNLVEEQTDIKRAVLCILTVDPAEDNAHGQRLKCVGNPRRNLGLVPYILRGAG